MLREWVVTGLVVLTLLGCVMMLLPVLGLLHQLRMHLSLRDRGLALEKERLSRPLPPDALLPHVVVQIASFNEGRVIERSIAAAANLDWPKDKLHVQVCDDSIDGTTDLARAAADRAVAGGIDVVVIHRTDRIEFKAGALREAMEKTPHDYFAVFDVDFVPPADFLRRSMVVLLSESNVAFTQARIDHLNADENVLTRAQAVMLDFHYGVEQATRSWAQQVLPFNGTCGVWRRAAIYAGGGWSGATLNEDWDLSYRAWLKGWRGVLLTTVAVPGELPTRFGAWTVQQDRWAIGLGQVATRITPLLVRHSGVSARERWGAFFPLVLWVGYIMYAATLFPAIAAVLLKPSLALPLGLGVYAVYLVGWLGLFVVMFAANRSLGRSTPLWRFILNFLVVPYLALYISWKNLRSLPATLLGRRRAFIRTPKHGSVNVPSVIEKKPTP